jgi:phosphonopyruvate decarboxylase
MLSRWSARVLSLRLIENQLTTAQRRMQPLSFTSAMVFVQSKRRQSDAVVAETAASSGIHEQQRTVRPMTETIRTFLNPAHFFALLRANGTTFFAGVPDSLLKDMCAFVTDNVPAENHVITSNEGSAIAMAAGHYLGSRRIPCVYLQNSGLGNTVNPLLSLCAQRVYSIPVLLIIGWRGEPGKKDEPQHLVQGAVTASMLKEMGIPHEILPDYAEGAFEILKIAYEFMEKNQAPFALLVKKQTFAGYKMRGNEFEFREDGLMSREEVLQLIINEFPSYPLVTTTGFTSRELFELRESNKESHELDFLTVGSMGHCSSIALGVAAAKPNQPVICVDGDGAALMHMGSFATVGKCGLPNFYHILVNNAIHDSVGGQPTGAEKVDFVAIARACGYSTAASASSAEQIKEALQLMNGSEGPHFLEVRAKAGARADLGRPTTSTHENKEAFMTMLSRN